MSTRIHKLPEVGATINDLKVTGVYRDSDKKIRVKGACTVCGREKEFICYSSVVRRAKTFHRSCRKTTNANDVLYAYYGGREIKSDEFALFVDFYDKIHDSYLEAVKKYGDESVVSLDRIDPDKDYTADNCRWISLDEQKKNKRNSRWFEAISPTGEKFIACNRVQFAKRHGLKRVTINSAPLYGYNNRAGWKFRFLTAEEIKTMNLVDRLSSEECND